MASADRIIDIDPVEAGSAGAPEGFRRPSNGRRGRERVDARNVEVGTPGPAGEPGLEPIEFRAPSYGKAKPAAASGEQGAAGERGAGVGGVLAGAAQTVAGAAVMAAGVPMLVLPGPGLLTIGAGAALAGGGIKKMTSKGKDKHEGEA